MSSLRSSFSSSPRSRALIDRTLTIGGDFLAVRMFSAIFVHGRHGTINFSFPLKSSAWLLSGITVMLCCNATFEPSIKSTCSPGVINAWVTNLRLTQSSFTSLPSISSAITV